MVYRLHKGVAGNKIQKLKQKITNLTMAAVLALTSLGSAPLLWIKTASAVAPTTGMTIFQDGVEIGCGAAVINQTITVKWDASTDPDFDYYKYQADADMSAPYDFTTTVSTKSRTGTIRDTEGTYNYRVAAVDTSGAQGDWSDWCSITYDKTSPSAPTITAPTPEQYFQSKPILNTWNPATDNLSGISYYQIAYNYDDGHSFGSSTCSSLTITGYTGFIGCRNLTGTSRNHTPGSTEQGGVTIWVRAFDKAGNISEWSTPVHYYYDSIPPAQPTLVSPANDSVVKGTSITQSWSSSSSDIDYYIYESYNDSGATSLRWRQEYSTTSKTATNVASSMYWWRVKAVDYAGNESAWSELWKITVDNDAPLIEITNVSENPISGEVTIEGTASDAGSGLRHSNTDTTGTPRIRVSLRVQPSNTVVKTFFVDVDGSGNWSTTVDTTAHAVLVDGEYRIVARANDNVGVTYADSNTAADIENVTIDNTPPEVEITAPADGDFVSGIVIISGDVVDANPDHYYLTVKDSAGAIVDGPETVNQANVEDFPWDTSLLADGTYTIFLSARDAAGNKDGDQTTPGASVDSITVTVDNEAPEIEDVLPVNMRVGEKVTLEPEVTDNNAGPFTYAWRVSDPLLLNDPKNTMDGETLTIGPTKKGSYDVYLIVTDKAGNESEEAHYVVTVTTPDVAAPQSNENPQTLGATNSNSSNGSSNSRSNRTASTTQNEEPALPEETEGEVQGATTSTANLATTTGTETAQKSGAFLGLGWWWVPLLVMLFGFFFLALGRRSDDKN